VRAKPFRRSSWRRFTSQKTGQTEAGDAQSAVPIAGPCSYNEQMNRLKLNTQAARQRGTTLIELSVVIAVLLLLVGVLFIGITAWKNGANTAACIVNLSSVQKAARGYANMNQLLVASPETSASLTSSGFWSTAPTCPAGGSYAYKAVVPSQGVAYVTCNLSGHAPTSTSLANW
jgi:prepilin-type N-terminal cleavage/methylation domain-containing protein